MLKFFSSHIRFWLAVKNPWYWSALCKTDRSPDRSLDWALNEDARHLAAMVPIEAHQLLPYLARNTGCVTHAKSCAIYPAHFYSYSIQEAK